MAGFAAIHQIDILDVDLPDLEGKVIELLLNTGQCIGRGFGDLV